MAEQVGAIYYDVELNTAGMIEGERRIRSSINVLDRDITKLNLKIKPLGASITALFAIMAAGSVPVAIMADNFRLLEARVNIAAGSMQLGKIAFEQIYQISRDTNTSLEANVAVFTRLNQSMLQMGGTQQDTIRLTELLSKATMASGASAQEAAASMQQFGQALGSGVLQGDELRSILENNAKLAMALAEGLGVPVGALKKLGEQGKLTSDVVVKALGNAAASIERDFAQIPQTLEKTAGSAVDALSKLTFELDEQAGVSATLTGITDGLGKSFDLLSNSIDDVDQETANLQRKDAIKKWSDRAVVGMSYLADAADKTWQTLSVLGRNVAFVFESIGKEIGGRAAQAKAFFSGEFEMAGKIGADMAADSAARRAALDKADEESLKARKSWGQHMREEFVKGASAPKGGMGPVQPLGTGLKSTAMPDDKKKPRGQKFDSQGYINDLVIANADGLAKVDAQEKDALDKAKKLLDEKKLTQQEYEQAVTLIRLAASKDREEIQQRERDDLQSWLDEQLRMEEEAAQKRQQAFENARSTADPMAALRAEYEAKLVLFDEYQAQLLERGIVAETDQQAARTAITAEYEAQRQALAEQTFRSQSDANAFLMDSLDSLSSTASNAIGGLIDGTMTGKEAMIALGRTIRDQAIQALVEMGIQYIKNLIIGQTASAAAVATAAATGTGIAAAYAPAAAMASLATLGANAVPAAAGISSTVGLASTLALAGGRQYGGPVAADSLYRVNENGAPEMFTASNGRQYMMPNARGEVTPANKLGGGVSVVVNNYASGVDVSATQTSDGNVEVTVQRAVAEVASQIASNSGQVWSAMKGATNVQSKL